jgi:hypothetical protein
MLTNRVGMKGGLDSMRLPEKEKYRADLEKGEYFGYKSFGL